MDGLIASLRELTFWSTALRMALAVLFGGAIGLEREYKRQAAGFRTYMLVCLGAATTVMLGQYEYLMVTTRWADTAALVGLRTDVSRFGAQVINGIGFLGAGAILVTARNEVHGMTTAACLWASACMGLAIGAGFYECTVVGFAFIFITVKLLPYVENKILLMSRNITFCVECGSMADLQQIVECIRRHGATINTIEPESSHTSEGGIAFVIAIRMPKKYTRLKLLSELTAMDCVGGIEEV